jgi:hypothetical protein
MSVTGPATVAFELDRFELQADRLTVTGRWFGVRGRRFVRPSLSRAGAGGSDRVLAELEHKPWPAADGEPWEAAFPWPGRPPAQGEFELVVAPDICVQLPSPAAGERELVLEAFRPGESPDGAPPRRPRETPAPADAAPPGPDAPVKAARAERDEAVLRTRQAEARHAELARQWERAVGNRDRALSERDEARRGFEEARGERDEARAERERTLSELRTARSEHESALAARDQFSAALAGATEARDRALLQRERAIAERDAVAGELRAALAEVERRRAAAPPPTPTPASPVTAPPPPVPARPRNEVHVLTRAHMRSPAMWTTRMLALAALAVIVLVLLITIASK